MARLVFLLACTGLLLFGAIVVCTIGFAMPASEAAPHAVIAVAAAAAHFIAERTIPAYGDTLTALRNIIRRLFTR